MKKRTFKKISGNANSTLSTTSTVLADGVYRIKFEAYTNTIENMGMSSFSDTVIVGKTFDYDAVMSSSTIGHNGGITYSVRNTDGTTTDKATINSTTGVLTALKAGTVQIVTTYTNAPYLWIWNVEIDYRYTLSLEVVYDNAYNTLFSTTVA